MEMPKSFKIGKQTHYVYLSPNLTPRSLGRCHPDMGTIEIATLWKRLPRTAEAISETFWHEATHCILKDMGHHLWNDEEFVTRFSQRLNQLVHTAKLGG